MRVPHTPGPWFEDSERDLGDCFIRASAEHIRGVDHDCDYLVCTVAGNEFAPWPEQEKEANIRLICASPELLEMLYIALPFIEDAKDDPAYKSGRVAQVEARIRAVIIKAGGEL